MRKKVEIVLATLMILTIIVSSYIAFFKRLNVTLEVENKNYIIKTKERTIVNLPIILKNGYDFKGWVDEDNKPVKKPFSTQNNIKLKPILEKSKKEEVIEDIYKEDIQIIFDSRGGTNIDNLKIKNNSLIEEYPIPTKEGYEFKCWEDAKGNQIVGKAIIINDITLYAHWVKY